MGGRTSDSATEFSGSKTQSGDPSTAPVVPAVKLSGAEPGFIQRNVRLMVMLALAALCALIAQNAWVLLASFFLECAIWVDERVVAPRAPAKHWKRALFVLFQCGSLPGLVLGAQAIQHGSGAADEIYPLLLLVLQCIGGNLLVSATWLAWESASSKQKDRDLPAFVAIMIVGFVVAIGTSVWIRCW